jgi:methionyl-tRNA formyltransferase
MVKRLSIAFVGGGEVGCAFLDILVRAHDEGECRIAAIVPGNKGKDSHHDIARRARRSALPVLDGLAALEAMDDDIDLVVSAGNHLIFSASQIARPRLGIVNFHAAPLPKYRGSACPAFAILNGEATFGATFHLVAPELDAGQIVHDEKFALTEDMTAGDVDRTCIAVGNEAFRSLLNPLLNGRVSPRPPAPPSTAPYRRKDLDAHREVDLSWPEERIWRHVRAFDWPHILQPAFVRVGGKAVYLTARARGVWL